MRTKQSNGSDIAPEVVLKSKTHWQGRWGEILRFLVFGTINTLLAYGLYLILFLFLAYPIAYTISYASCILISYILNAQFVFKQRLRLSRALQYPLVYAVQYLFGIALLCLLVEFLHVSKFLAPFVVVFLTVPVTYCLTRYIIKR